jgi:hypothetical protein
MPDSFPGRWAAMGALLPAALSGKNPPTIPRHRPCHLSPATARATKKDFEHQALQQFPLRPFAAG